MFGKIIFNIHNSSSLAVLTSVFLVFIVLINAFFFDFFSLNVYGIVVVLLSVTLSSYIFVRWIVDKFIYNKIKLIYKNISDNKATPGYLEGVDLDKVDRDVAAWSENRDNEIEKLEIRESYRRQFVGNVAHELKTPIFNIQGYIDTLLDGAIEDPNINRKFLGEKLVSKNEASFLNSKGKNSSTLLGLRSGIDYYLREDLNLNLVAYFRFSYRSLLCMCIKTNLLYNVHKTG